MNVGIVKFPGSSGYKDCMHILSNVLGMNTRFIWHKDRDTKGLDLIVLPGGASFGDYIRCGAIAKLSPIISKIIEFADKGGLVLGIGNGFQILTEIKLLPGALIRNKNLRFICKYVHLRVDNVDTRFTTEYQSSQVIQVPIAHNQGCYTVGSGHWAEIKQYNQIVFRYCSPDGEIFDDLNPDGAKDNVAGIVNKAGNVLGMMPRPERCAETLMYSQDGLGLFKSIKNFLG